MYPYSRDNDLKRSTKLAICKLKRKLQGQLGMFGMVVKAADPPT